MIEAGNTILLLEDEAIIAFALEDMLVADGAKVLMVGSVTEAAASIEQGGIDFAVLDVNVHGEKSYGVGELLGRLGIPFVFATGYGDASHPDEFGHIPTVSKPYTHQQIRSAMAVARLAVGGALPGRKRALRGGENRPADL
ncbi:MAG: response regulator [Alphaproteobacteria bacterium]|jgi:DNA-binding NtrC family response regulator|nr:response regulator [Alphaproteobacteria bacterium]MBU1606533.1 response regulator [Alphaproteobacteria bacterium]MBU2329512.1 response regulator [Alphaproteobacteria bacterium]